MKGSNLTKIFGASALALSLSILPSTMPVSAQTGTTTSPDTTTTQPGTAMDNNLNQGTDSTVREDDGFDWGWLGLIGLAGLAGLARKKEEPTRYRDPGTAGTPGYRE